MTQSDQIPLAGVMGDPIVQSKSPALHGHWLQRYGIRGYYIPLNVHPNQLRTALTSLPLLGFRGVNVTIPHKEAVLGVATQVSDRARKIGAANTLTFLPEGGFHADNTDGEGFLANLYQNAPNWNASKGPAAIIGAGGAARAIISALLEAGAPEIRISNRSAERAENLCKEFGNRLRFYSWEETPNMFPQTALLVNTTSLGMMGKEAFPFSLNELHHETVVTDIVYNPLITPFLNAAAKQGCQIVDGLGMLLHQAAPGFERWFGRRPDVDSALREAVLGK